MDEYPGGTSSHDDRCSSAVRPRHSGVLEHFVVEPAGIVSLEKPFKHHSGRGHFIVTLTSRLDRRAVKESIDMIQKLDGVAPSHLPPRALGHPRAG